MMRQGHTWIAFVLISITTLFHSAILTGADLDPEYRYNEESGKGPEHWGEMKEEWATCKNGEMQSPIDLTSHRVEVVPKLGVLKRNYNPQHASLLNRGHDVAVKWEGDTASIEINGTHFFLRESHWHWPSEHTINGRRYDLELHMVHVSPQPDGTNKTAVVGLLYKYGPPDPFLSQLGKYMTEFCEGEEEESIGVMDPSEIKMGGKMYYRYMGSLTVPPCTQGIIWTINKKVRTVSRGQVKLLKHTVLKYYAKRNARPLQLRNEREVQLYDPKAKEKYYN